MRAVIVSVDFADLLAVTLAYNRHHFDDILIITSFTDHATLTIAHEHRCQVYQTQEFYNDDAKFNKFLALESGLDKFGRTGWLAFLDADILWPKILDISPLVKDKLYSIRRRRLLLDVTKPIPPESEWKKLPLDPQVSECMGFTQIFNCEALCLRKTPWHRLDLPTAALGDSQFQNKWDLDHKVWLDADCLHLGNYAENWCGRVTQYRDGSYPKSRDELLKQNKNYIDKLWAPEVESGHYYQEGVFIPKVD